MRKLFWAVDLGAIVTMNYAANHWTGQYMTGLFIIALILYVNAKVELGKEQ